MAGEYWKDEPEVEDFPAARSYLSLLVGPSAATKLSKALSKANKLEHFAAKDILRAAGLPLLAQDDSEVAADLKKVGFGEKLSPVLLVLGGPTMDRRRLPPSVRELSPRREDFGALPSDRSFGQFVKAIWPIGER